MILETISCAYCHSLRKCSLTIFTFFKLCNWIVRFIYCRYNLFVKYTYCDYFSQLFDGRLISLCVYSWADFKFKKYNIFLCLKKSFAYPQLMKIFSVFVEKNIEIYNLSQIIFGNRASNLVFPHIAVPATSFEKTSFFHSCFWYLCQIQWIK